MTQKAPLVLFLVIADAALAFSFRTPIPWALLVVPIAAAFVRAPRVPAPLANVLTWTAWVLVAAVAARGNAVGLPAGLVLAALAGGFLVDDRAFSVARAFLPAAIGVFLAAASNASAPHFTPLAWLGTAALGAWLSRPLTPPLGSEVKRIATIAVPASAIGYGLLILLPWAQPRVEEATAKLMDPTSASTGLSIGGSLGDVQRLAVSRRIVLRMWNVQPVNLRAGVYTQFDGRAWRLARLVPGSRPAPRSGPPSTLARFVVEEQSAGFLPAPPNVDAVDADKGPIVLDRFGLVHAPSPAPDRYAIAYTPGPMPVRERDDDIVRECLQIPAATDVRVRELARQLGSESASAKEKIDRTLSHLQARCRYSLDVGAFRTADPVAEFLFEKKRGYCEYFASAAVMLLRLQGVPARYVNGLSVRDDDRRGDHFVVRASDAHAWAEALLPGVGWVEVDATPPGDYAAVHAGGHGLLEDAVEAVSSWWIAASIPRVIATLALSLVGIVAAIVVIRRVLQHRRQTPTAVAVPFDVPPELIACLRRVEAVWTRAGHPRPPHRALLEHVRAMPAEAMTAELRAASMAAVGDFYRAAYGAEAVTPDDIAQLDRAIDGAERSAIIHR